jgi:hypothetical protein
MEQESVSTDKKMKKTQAKKANSICPIVFSISTNKLAG